MTLRAPRLPIAVDPLIAEAKQRARRRRINVACVLATGACVAVGLSLPSTPGGPEQALGSPPAVGTPVTSLNASGFIGPLRLDHSSAADIRHFAGRPDFDGTGSFEATFAGNPAAYLALGYGCSPEQSSAGRDPGGSRAAHLYCRTVYYLNPRTHALAAVWTASPTFRTSAGTRPGMNERTAAGLERSAFAGLVRTTGAGGLALETSCTIGVSETPAAAPSCNGRVTALVFESRNHGVGLLFR